MIGDPPNPTFMSATGALLSGMGTSVAALAGVIGWLLARRSKRKEKQVVRESTEAEILTHRIQMLMNGYESRIEDLVGEVKTLRETVEALRSELEQQRNGCAGCPYFNQRQHDGTD